MGDPILLEPPYALPEKGHSEAEDRIVDFYYTYNTFLLYDYTEEDFAYGNSSMEYHSLPGDIRYLEPMLDLLEEVWLDFYPEGFKKKYLPFKIYLADKISYTNKWSGMATYYDYVVRTSDIVIAGMNEGLLTMTPQDKQKMKSVINNAYISYIIAQKDADGLPLLNVPQSFYDVCDYTTDFCSVADFNKLGNPDIYLELGYLPSLDQMYTYSDYSPQGSVSNWAYSIYVTGSSKDLNTFLSNMLMIGDDFPVYPDYPANAPYGERYTWNYYLQKNADGSYKFPRIKQKLDILEGYFKENFDLDLRAIGNKKFE